MQQIGSSALFLNSDVFNTQRASFDDPWTLAAMKLDLLEQPLEFIFAEHHRQRQAALMLHLVADEEFNRQGVCDLIDFLQKEFSLHIRDEEDGLFPILVEQCEEEDGVESLIERLQCEHQNDATISEKAIGLLHRLIDGEKIDRAGASCLRAFAENIRQHLAVENAVLLPIARVRMSAAACAALTEILKQHRA